MENKLEQQIQALSIKLPQILKGNTISLAESCTGGLVAAYITDVPGASQYFLASVVAYDNQAKIDMLDVKEESLRQYGAVSWQVAREMALGVKIITESDIALAITGIAGPGCASDEKPVGTVCFAIAYNGECNTQTYYFHGLRNQIRKEACYKALELISACAINA
jgi:PncC family amidohydrolase